MVAIGVMLVWAGYTVGLWGYCLVQGYDVQFSGLFAKSWPGPAAAAAAPPPAADPGVGTFNV
jgi:hypothetical protein